MLHSGLPCTWDIKGRLNNQFEEHLHSDRSSDPSFQLSAILIHHTTLASLSVTSRTYNKAQCKIKKHLNFYPCALPLYSPMLDNLFLFLLHNVQDVLWCNATEKHCKGLFHPSVSFDRYSLSIIQINSAFIYNPNKFSIERTTAVTEIMTVWRRMTVWRESAMAEHAATKGNRHLWPAAAWSVNMAPQLGNSCIWTQSVVSMHSV